MTISKEKKLRKKYLTKEFNYNEYIQYHPCSGNFTWIKNYRKNHLMWDNVHFRKNKITIAGKKVKDSWLAYYLHKGVTPNKGDKIIHLDNDTDNLKFNNLKLIRNKQYKSDKKLNKKELAEYKQDMADLDEIIKGDIQKSKDRIKKAEARIMKFKDKLKKIRLS